MSKTKSVAKEMLEQPGKTTVPPTASELSPQVPNAPDNLATTGIDEPIGEARPLVIIDFKAAKALPLKMAAFIAAKKDTVVRTYLTNDFEGQIIEEKHALDGESPSSAELNVPLRIVSVSVRYGVGIDEDQEVFESIFTTIELENGKVLRLSGNPACDSLLPRIATNMSSGQSLRENPIIMKLVKRNSKSSSKNSYYWFERPTAAEIAASNIGEAIPPVPNADHPF